MISQDVEHVGLPRYRVREAQVEVCNGYRCWKERRFIAERRVVAFGLHLWWWPVPNAEWRVTVELAAGDAERDRCLRLKPYLKKVLHWGLYT